MNKKHPNILLVFSDQHRWCDMGCYGNPQVSTPNLDAFAGEAMVFNQCISNSPVCVPARGSLLTGLFPLRHGAVTNDLPIRQEVTSLADVLDDSGYHTGYIGKWHLAGVPRDQSIPRGRGRLGFTEWKAAECNHDYLNGYYFDEQDQRIAIEGYEPVGQTDLAIDFMTRNRNAAPWALVLSWSPPHDPYLTAPEKHFARYRDAKIKPRANVPDIIRHTLQVNYTKAQVEEFTRGYYAHISALDEQFGRLIDSLKETGQLDNTIVVYTSDHGDMLGSQGCTNKQWPYEESVRVPLVISWKGHTLCKTSNELISLVDLPVSLARLAGTSFPEGTDGLDLHRLFLEEDARGPEACYMFDLIPCHQAAWRGSREWRGIRTARHTFARSAVDEGFALYDHVEDPLQMDNLVHRSDREDLKQVLSDSLDKLIARHDRLLPWEDFIREFGLKDEWNKSQACFGMPLLD